jgi:hypothetical protein
LLAHGSAEEENLGPKTLNSEIQKMAGRNGQHTSALQTKVKRDVYDAGYSFLVVPLLVFLVLLTNKLDNTVKISYFAATSPLFLTFFTLLITSFGSRGG